MAQMIFQGVSPHSGIKRKQTEEGKILHHQETQWPTSPTCSGISRDKRPRKKLRPNSIASSLQLSALHLAALKGLAQEVQRLLQQDKVDVDTIVDALGNSPLHIAAGSGSAACCAVLLDHGASKDLGNQNGLTPLHLAIRHNQKECFSMLLRYGANLYVGNIDGITPLHIAAKYGRVEILRTILDHFASSGASVDPTDSWGQTPLHYTCLQKGQACVEMLLQASARMLPDHIGMTPLLSAASVGATSCVVTLLKNGARVDDKNRNGKTALHLAVQKGHFDCLVELLKVSTAHVNSRDKTGVSPLLEARAAGFADCEALLLRSGAIDYTLDADDLKCPVCHDVLFHSITLACGHVYCRACLQAARKLNDRCPVCRESIRLVEGYTPNARLDTLVRQSFPDLSAQRIQEQKSNSMETMIRNMEVFGRALGKEIVLDRNHTCILSIDNEFPMHLTFLPHKDQLFIYAPLAAKFPRDASLCYVYEMLLNESFIGSGLSGGGVGVLLEKELILFHVELDMLTASDSALNQTSLLFVETVKRWRRRIAQYFAGAMEEGSCQLPVIPRDGMRIDLTAKRFGSCSVDKAGIWVARQNIQAICEEYDAPFKMFVKVETKDWEKESLVRLTVRRRDTKCYLSGESENEYTTVKLFYDSETDQITAFSPILDLIPTDIDLLPLYEKLLQTSAFGFKTLGGGFGFAVDDDGTVKLMTYGRVGMKRVPEPLDLSPKSWRRADICGDTNSQAPDTPTPIPEWSTAVVKDWIPVFIEQVYQWRVYVKETLGEASMRT